MTLEVILEFLSPYLLEAIAALFTIIIIPYLVGVLKQWRVHLFLQNEAEIVVDAMELVESIYHRLNGPGKVEKAKEFARAKAKRVGINIPEEDLDELIATILAEFKEQFPDWRENH